MRIHTIKAKMSRFRKNQSGSEALEFVYSAALCCFLILSCLLILGYALQVSSVTYAGKRLARYVEVGGSATQQELNLVMKALLSNAEELNASVSVTPDNGWVNTSQKKIQLREPFTLTIKAYYTVNLIASGTKTIPVSIPIVVNINGQSEVYWKT